MRAMASFTLTLSYPQPPTPQMNRPLQVAAVRDLGPQFVSNPHRMVGQDGAYSIPLGDGTALWFFGDTLVGERPAESLWFVFGEPIGGRDMTGHGPFEAMITNTGLVLPDQRVESGLKDYRYLLDADGGLRKLVPSLAPEVPHRDRIWCLHGVALGAQVYLYYIRVRMHEEGGDPFPVGFDLEGSGLAVGTKGVWDFRRIAHDGETLWWKAGEPMFCSAVLPVDDHVYGYGVRMVDGVQQCACTRVEVARIEDLSAYRYFDGDGWSPHVADAVPVMRDMPNEMSVSWNAYLGAYLAVHSFNTTREVVGRTAPQPWGPWSSPVTLFIADVQLPEPPRYPLLVYAGKEHPELTADGGRVLYVTYLEFEEYYPRLVEVTLD